MVAFDTDTGQILSDDEAVCAADNPAIYTWVEWRDNA